jgi:hypothetical protein
MGAPHAEDGFFVDDSGFYWEDTTRRDLLWT